MVSTPQTWIGLALLVAGYVLRVLDAMHVIGGNVSFVAVDMLAAGAWLLGKENALPSKEAQLQHSLRPGPPGKT
jgi:membrane-bound ClpP family serine protease